MFANCLKKSNTAIDFVRQPFMQTLPCVPLLLKILVELYWDAKIGRNSIANPERVTSKNKGQRPLKKQPSG